MAELFADLLAEPGVVEEVALRSAFGVMAFHGGSLERGTDLVARRVAAASGASLYTVALPEGLTWHIPSHRVDPAASTKLAAFLAHVDAAVAVHGYGRPDMWTTILVGGRHRELARHVGAALRAALADYTVVDDLEEVPAPLRGQDPRNPVNRVGAGGVHLELPPRVRGIGPFWDAHEPGSPNPHTEALVDALVRAVGTWGS